MPDIGGWEILIIAVVVLILFGSTKLPTAARSLGRSMRIFKSETKGLVGDDDPEPTPTGAQTPTPTDAQTPTPTGAQTPTPQESDLHAQATRLREQAARLEQSASREGLHGSADDDVISGVPVSNPDRRTTS